MDHPELPADYRLLLQTLRSVLKAKGITYAKLARRMEVSEVTVKRWFGGQTCSLRTFFQICDEIGASFLDVAALARSEEEVDYVLSEKQETFFAANLALFGVLKCLQRGEDAAKVARAFRLDRAEFYRQARKLEKQGVLEVLPGDRIRVTVTGNIRYQHHGPLGRVLLRPQITRFLDHIDTVLRDDDVVLHSAEVALSHAHAAELVDELHALGSKYRARAYRDQSLLPPQKLKPSRWLLAYAPYRTDWTKR